MIKDATNRSNSKFNQIVDPVMEIFRQVQGRRGDESLQNLLSFLDTHVESKSSDKEDYDDDGEGSFYSRSLSLGNGLGLNPHAEVFVPSFLKSKLNKPEAREPDTKSEATSTTSLQNDDDENDSGLADDQEDTFNIQRQIFEFLSQMGDEKLSLDTIKITLLPEGHGINIQFTTDQQELSMPGKSISAEDLKKIKSFKEHLCRQTVLNLDIADQEKLANKPENVLVAQFLQRASELLSEKYEWNAPNSTKCDKCSIIWANRSYTEAEIEQQIECIKSFEKFISLTGSIKFQDLSDHKEFQELCCKLGLITDKDQVNLSEPQPPTTATPEKDLAEEEDPQAITEYVCGKIYRYDDSNGQSTLVNQLEDDGDDHINRIIEGELLIYNEDQPSLDAPPTTPAMSMTITGLASPSKVRKSPKTKGSARPQTHSSNGGPPRKNGKLQNEKVNLNIQKMRLNEVNGTASTKTKTQLGALHPSGKKASTIQHATLPMSSGMQPPIVTSMTGRRQGSARLATGLNSGKQRMASSSTSYGPKATKLNSTKGNLVAPVQMVPRSTTASLMRQSAVKRRLNMLRGDSDSDVPLHEYLFK
ncbi:uncharacterized protein Dwil_GK24309 [Drosophila willistoni]|uniref:Uncharacterized protein n=1 Tax=Drosophila willistoni TaxID=7260 RepID=B4MZU6_DROWI|nr:uncharacterized protein LOC6643861 [Drosophila willistoni]EDW77881.2 uncharacterized protein Dwil_GK24309 [Drosophila willistoni]